MLKHTPAHVCACTRMFLRKQWQINPKMRSHLDGRCKPPETVRCVSSERSVFDQNKGMNMGGKQHEGLLNLNCSSYSSCFLSFCSCSFSYRDRGSYSSSGASVVEWEWTQSKLGKCIRGELMSVIKPAVNLSDWCRQSERLTLRVIWLADLLPFFLPFFPSLV